MTEKYQAMAPQHTQVSSREETRVEKPPTRLFAEIMAEAEAVRDQVYLSPRAGGAGRSGSDSRGFADSIQYAWALLQRPFPWVAPNLRGVKPRQESRKGEL